MPDLTPLLTWLQAQGNLGALVVILLPLLGWFLNRKYGPTAQPTSPTPTLDLILKALGIAPKDRPAVATDLPHEVHLQLQDVLDKVSATKASLNAKQLDDYHKLGLVDNPPAK